MSKEFNIMNHIQVTGIGFGSRDEDEQEAKGVKNAIKKHINDSVKD